MAEDKLLIERKSDLFKELSALASKVKADSLSAILAKAYLRRMSSLETAFRELKIEIFAYNIDKEDDDELIAANDFENFVDLIDNINCYCVSAIEDAERADATAAACAAASASVNSSAPKIPNNNNAILPKIKIAPFSGDVSDWHRFFSMYDATIHKSTLSNTAKFYHLRSVLEGEALKVVELFEIDDANYTLAYDALVKRYQNVRLRASYYLNRILSYKPGALSTRDSLQTYINAHKDSVDSYKALKVKDHADFLLFFIAYRHLDKSCQSDFDKVRNPDDVPTFEELSKFVTARLQYADLNKESLSDPQVDTRSKPQKPKASTPQFSNRQHAFIASTDNKSKCCYCKDSHYLFHCSSFLSLSAKDKRAFVHKANRCFNCLGSHYRNKCQSSSRCRTCNGSHHSLLHLEEKSTAPSVPAVSAEESPASSSQPMSTSPVVLSASMQGPQTVLLGTAVVDAQDQSGHPQPLRTVIDPGSQVSIFSEQCVKRLGLKITRANVEISGISHTATKVLGLVKCHITSRVNRKFSLNIEAVVMSSLPHVLPSSSLPTQVKQRFENLRLADPMFDTPAYVDGIFGASVYVDILKEGHPMVGGDPTALDTAFGWLIIGRVPTVNPQPNTVSLFATCDPLDSLLRRFWEIEETSAKPPIAPEDDFCEKHFVSTHARSATGRYQVGLPFKPDAPPMGFNRNKAIASYLKFEKRLITAELHEKYVKDLQGYIDAGYMIPAHSPSQYVIPQNLIIKEDSSTTAARTVFNASAVDDSGFSLNDRIFAGPKLQQDLAYVLSGFRLHRIAISSDIKKMYLQIQVKEPDCFSQAIVWRRSPHEPLLDYVIRVVTFGVNCSPFLALRVIRQLVCDEGSEFPLAAAALLTGTYMDNIVGGASTIEEARDFCRQLTEMLGRGGFYPRKWACSHAAVLEDVPDEDKDQPIVIRDPEDAAYKVLGLEWHPTSDAFTYTVKPFTASKITKRTVLSFAARLFSPLGLLAPVIFTIKAFMQKLWLAGVGWDDDLPLELCAEWNAFHEQFLLLTQVQVSRFVPNQNADELHLIGFCDASTRGYAAVIYLRARFGNDVHVSLLRSRTKVAPLKTLSVPKLELQAAVLLVRLLNNMEDFRKLLPPHSCLFFSDSTLALHYIRTPPHRLKTFCANRVVEILETTNPASWFHCSTEVNPSDCGSRGLLPIELLDHPLWWSGPPFLREPPESWLGEPPPLEDPAQLELKSAAVLLTSAPESEDLFCRFSCLKRLQSAYAYVHRFLFNLRHPKSRIVGPLSAEELDTALLTVIRLQQQHSFQEDIKRIRRGSTLSPSLRALTPYLDGNGLVRVGGRLTHSLLDEDAKHPFLIGKSHLARLICLYYHALAGHSGSRTCQAMIQQRFWILGIRPLLRRVIHGCVTCARFRAETVRPVMAPLPSTRVRPSRCFTVCGTDLAGPFRMKDGSRRNSPISKVYLCVFICFSTKAVHLEPLTALSTEAFLACFDRFCGRRSCPNQMWSDQGRNFIGAARHFNEVKAFLKDNHDAIFSALATRSVSWKTIPSYSPTFGGLWEAAVKSAKSLMYKIIGEEALTFEGYATLFARIESVLNSRPLVACDSADEEIDYLSPGHFLVGTPLVSPPESLLDLDISLNCRWSRIRQLAQAFWRQWSNQYLQSQIKLAKWTRSKGAIVPGIVVLVTGLSPSPLSWPLGRVIKTIAGPDGSVRVATVKTQNGLITRAVNRLIVLPTEDVFA